MKVDNNGRYITIVLESELEADIMSAMLNWGHAAMKGSGLMTCDGSHTDNEKGKVETDMWTAFQTVHPYELIKQTYGSL